MVLIAISLDSSTFGANEKVPETVQDVIDLTEKIGETWNMTEKLESNESRWRT